MVRISEMLAAVRRLHGEGRTDTEVARALGVSASHAGRIRTRLGLPRVVVARPRSFSESSARRLHAQGWVDADVARRLGVSRETIQKWRVSEGLVTNGRTLPGT